LFVQWYLGSGLRVSPREMRWEEKARSEAEHGQQYGALLR
jgi:hypothetical protein